MSAITRMAALLAAGLVVGACATLDPALPEARSGVPANWQTQASPALAKTEAFVAEWQEFLADPKLVKLVSRALDHNRDLRVAVLNVERARALHRIQRADRVPSVGIAGTFARAGGDRANTSDTYSLNVGITSYEIDLFGRVRSLDKAGLEQYFAQHESRRSAQIALVAEVANAYLALAADRELQRLANATLANREEAWRLARKRHELGAASALDLSQALTAVESARVDAARYEGQVAKDINALSLVVGGPVEADLLPGSWEGPVSRWDVVPADLSSRLLLGRPDVRRAEHLLRAANANIGAARAAFFPSIRLTGTAGNTSNELSGLFRDGAFAWSIVPQVNVPIFQGGRLEAGLDVAKVDRDIALAQYEKAIQAGFREVADALALADTLVRQRSAQELLVEAAVDADRLSRARHDAGRDSYLTVLDAQRTLYAAQQGLIVTRLAEQANRLSLHKVLGGGLKEAAP